MLRAFSRFLITIPLFFFWPLKCLVREPSWRSLRVLCLVWLLLPLFILLQASHWIGFLVDAVFFPEHREIPLEPPLFVTGIPRSGTTHLQRVLARHSGLTSMVLWECLFAPSIAERKLYSGFAWGARAVFRPVGKVLAPLNRMRIVRSALAGLVSTLRRFDKIHTLGLDKAEEDFVALITVNACFLLVVLFPEQAWYWRLSRFDDDLSVPERHAILRFYKSLIQKHLYFHDGPAQPRQLRYLSKNPSFLPWLDSLREQFPGAHFVLCTREPTQAVASQLSALRPAWRVVQGGVMTQSFVASVVQMLGEFYYRLDREVITSVSPIDFNSHQNVAVNSSNASQGNLECHSLCKNSASEKLSSNEDVILVPMTDLVGQLVETVTTVLTFAQVRQDSAFVQTLRQIAQQARAYRSAHQYDLSDFSVNWTGVESLFPMRFRAHAYRAGVVL